MALAGSLSGREPVRVCLDFLARRSVKAGAEAAVTSAAGAAAAAASVGANAGTGPLRRAWADFTPSPGSRRASDARRATLSAALSPKGADGTSHGGHCTPSTSASAALGMLPFGVSSSSVGAADHSTTTASGRPGILLPPGTPSARTGNVTFAEELVEAAVDEDQILPSSPPRPLPSAAVRGASRVYTVSSMQPRVEVKNTFIHVEALCGDSDSEDDALGSGFGSSQPALVPRSISAPNVYSASLGLSPAAGGSFATAAPALLPLAPLEASPQAPLEASPQAPQVDADAPLPSIGSVEHASGTCRPCAWFWKPQSCTNGAECRHCHLCPQGEIKRRRKVKFNAMKAERSSDGAEVTPGGAAESTPGGCDSTPGGGESGCQSPSS
eukprot:TRINITY_DN2170_c0_g1_i1.p1 TRINITY_DN2170_c0_g1~~TRINITY_DN2170_c0_g1_i1.p1  ORF type:complete len:419 (-),score=65.70 TRINITY_DN2170_c0_g1_i1:156-1307(-)